jgi:hypothetical protein
MVYIIRKKQEELASETLYGPNVMRYRFDLETPLGKASADNYTSTLTVSREIFDTFKVGDSLVLAPFRYEPTTVDIALTADA